MNVSIVSKNKTPIEKLIETFIADSEENGGIGGNIRKKPLPFPVIEERSKTVDPRTGEVVYTDTLQYPGIINLIG